MLTSRLDLLQTLPKCPLFFPTTDTFPHSFPYQDPGINIEKNKKELLLTSRIYDGRLRLEPSFLELVWTYSIGRSILSTLRISNLILSFALPYKRSEVNYRVETWL